MTDAAFQEVELHREANDRYFAADHPDDGLAVCETCGDWRPCACDREEEVRGEQVF